MLIGTISDTHDNMPQIKKAVDFFNKRKVEHVVHAGDFTSPFTFRILKGLKCRFTGIFGNNDGDKLLLQKMSEGRLFNQPHIFELAGKKIILMHEHHTADALADSGHYDIVIYGHTHKPDVRKVKNTLVINPGEAGSWLYDKSTIAIADLSDMTAEIILL
ncbi:Phosphodiesterase [Candidatus Sulfobium mesophilum]|uniref:Phosphoesterase n=1 Tax=Candidatus Sulfobium mesophilum TaxID=2016548 RepID=A0A2U3QJ17_9BACT|nr:Phosphodiesterase [Candidatus Sulfobium mesophilum]